MFKVIPDFAYKLNIEGGTQEIITLKNRFLTAGADLISESDKSASLKISSNSLARAVYPFSKDLTIFITIEPNGIVVEVIRCGERRAALIFLSFVAVLSLAICFQDKSIEPLAFPILGYVLFYGASFIPAHPAHLKIKNMLQLDYERS